MVDFESKLYWTMAVFIFFSIAFLTYDTVIRLNENTKPGGAYEQHREFCKKFDLDVFYTYQRSVPYCAKKVVL